MAGAPAVGKYMILSVELAEKTGMADTHDKSICFGEIMNNPEGIFPSEFTVDSVRIYRQKIKTQFDKKWHSRLLAEKHIAKFN